MTQRCQFIKDNGERCKRLTSKQYCYNHDPNRKICAQPGCTKTAITGLEFCPVHRQDGGPKAGFYPGNQVNRMRIKSGFRAKPVTPDRLVDTTTRLESLYRYADTVTDVKEYERIARYLSILSGRLNRTLGQPGYTTEKEVEETIRREKALIPARLQREKEAKEAAKPEPTTRSPRYYQTLEYIEDYFQRYRKSPTHQEISEALNISKSAAQHYIDQLIEDKKLHNSPSSHHRCLRRGENKVRQLTFYTDQEP